MYFDAEARGFCTSAGKYLLGNIDKSINLIPMLFCSCSGPQGKGALNQTKTMPANN